MKRVWWLPTCIVLVGLLIIVVLSSAKPEDERKGVVVDSLTVAAAGTEVRAVESRSADVEQQESPVRSHSTNATQLATQPFSFGMGEIGLCQYDEESPSQFRWAVEGSSSDPCQEPTWGDARVMPWEIFAQGEYVGPHRTPHVNEYRVRVNDRFNFVYRLTREKATSTYRIQVGDELRLESSSHGELTQNQIQVQVDGSISLHSIQSFPAVGRTFKELQTGLIKEYGKWFENVWVTVIPVKTNLPLDDLRDSVRSSISGGQSQLNRVSPDGTIQLPWIDNVTVQGLTLEEVGREVNARYREKVIGIAVTPILLEQAPKFIYVLGAVNQPGRYQLEGPTTALQSISLAWGWEICGNLRQIVVLRRNEQWKLVATKIDLIGAVRGDRPNPSDEIWLRDSDIVLIPKRPIQEAADFVNLYFSQTLWGILPNQANTLYYDGTSVF